MTILGDWMTRHRAPAMLAPIAQGSGRALSALIDARVHAAGVHLCDSHGGEDNLGAVRGAIGRRRALMVNFARWELGLAVKPGSPLGLRGVADFARPGLRIVNRETGSGARLVLDRALGELDIDSRHVAGYERELSGHLEIAAAVAAGEAGRRIDSARRSRGLGFGFCASARRAL